MQSQDETTPWYVCAPLVILSFNSLQGHYLGVLWGDREANTMVPCSKDREQLLEKTTLTCRMHLESPLGCVGNTPSAHAQDHRRLKFWASQWLLEGQKPFCVWSSAHTLILHGSSGLHMTSLVISQIGKHAQSQGNNCPTNPTVSNRKGCGKVHN